MSDQTKAIAWLGLFSLGFATSNILFRAAGHRDYPSLPLLILALFAGTVLMVPLSLNESTSWRAVEVSARNIAYLFVLAITATVIPFWLQLEGFQRTTATKGGIILSLIPVLTTVFSRCLLKRTVTPSLALRLALMTVGGFLISWEGSLNSFNTGDWLILAAATCFAFSMVVAHELIQRWPVMKVIQGRLGIGLIILGPSLLFMEDLSLYGNAYFLVIGTAIGFLMVLFIVGIYRGMSFLGPEYASLFDIVAAVFTAVASYAIWGELMHSIQWMGAAIILALSVELFLNPPESESS